MSAKRKGRVKLLVEPKFQFTLLLYANGLAAILIGITSYSIFRFLNQLDSHLPLLTLTPEHPFFIFIQQQKRSIWALFIASSALVVFLANVGVFALGHRIAGPVYRIRKHLKSFKTGKEDKKLQFRKTDFFKDLEKDWNDFFEPLE